jgi:hypothetical protein
MHATIKDAFILNEDLHNWIDLVYDTVTKGLIKFICNRCIQKSKNYNINILNLLSSEDVAKNGWLKKSSAKQNNDNT